jgi:hypothetical protein
MLIIGLFLVGGGSAALLSTFGTVTGTADVDQAVELNSESAFSFDSTQTAGETIVETRTLQSNANVTTEIGFETTCGNSTDSNSKTGVDLNWSSSSGCTGIDTQYVEYYEAAGAELDSYDAPEEDVSVSDGESIQSEINEASDGDVIVISGTHDADVEVNESVTLAASDSGATINGQMDITVDGVTVKGFNLMTSNQVAVYSEGDDISGLRVLRNDFEDVSKGMYLKHTEDVVIQGNEFVDVDADAIGLDDSENLTIANNLIADGEDGVGTQATVKNLTIINNTISGGYSTFESNGQTYYYGAGIKLVGGQDIEIKMNNISGKGQNEPLLGSITTDSDGSYGWYTGGIVLQENGEGDDDEITITRNVLMNNQPYDVVATTKDGSWKGPTVSASNNFWGDSGVSTSENVDGSFEELSSTYEVASEATQEFGIVNEFAINLAPADYDLTTSITPAGAEETPS